MDARSAILCGDRLPAVVGHAEQDALGRLCHSEIQDALVSQGRKEATATSSGAGASCTAKRRRLSREAAGPESQAEEGNCECSGVEAGPASGRGVALQPHQQTVRDRSVEGTLPYPFYLYWSMGSGKTYACCGIMEGLVDVSRRQGRVLILCDKTLEGQWRKSVDRYFQGLPTPSIDVRRFQMLNKDLEPHVYDLCIVDEAHRFRNAFRTDTGAAVEYGIWIRQIMACPRVVYASGTPLVSDAKEDMQAFRQMMNPSKPLQGRVSRYDPQDDPRKVRSYAIVRRHEPVRCPMDWSQTLLYFVSQRSKFSLSFGGGSVTVQTSVRNRFSCALRSVANNPFPDDYAASPKFKRMLVDMAEAHEQGKRQVVYSSRRDLGARALFELWKTQPGVNARDCFIIDGSLDAEVRTAAVDKFNQKGAKVLFITDAGGQGVDLKLVDAVRLLEPNESVMEENQVINRGVRYKSHKGMKEPHVDVYLYVATFPSCSQPLDSRFASVVAQSKISVNSMPSEEEQYDIQAAVMKQYIEGDARGVTVDEIVLERRAIQHTRIIEGCQQLALLDDSVAQAAKEEAERLEALELKKAAAAQAAQEKSERAEQRAKELAERRAAQELKKAAAAQAAIERTQRRLEERAERRKAQEMRKAAAAQAARELAERKAQAMATLNETDEMGKVAAAQAVGDSGTSETLKRHTATKRNTAAAAARTRRKKPQVRGTTEACAKIQRDIARLQAMLLSIPSRELEHVAAPIDLADEKACSEVAVLVSESEETPGDNHDLIPDDSFFNLSDEPEAVELVPPNLDAAVPIVRQMPSSGQHGQTCPLQNSSSGEQSIVDKQFSRAGSKRMAVELGRKADSRGWLRRSSRLLFRRARQEVHANERSAVGKQSLSVDGAVEESRSTRGDVRTSAVIIDDEDPDAQRSKAAKENEAVDGQHDEQACEASQAVTLDRETWDSPARIKQEIAKLKASLARLQQKKMPKAGSDVRAPFAAQSAPLRADPGQRVDWLPREWEQCIKTSCRGTEYRCYRSPEGRVFYHRCKIEKYVGMSALPLVPQSLETRILPPLGEETQAPKEVDSESPASLMPRVRLDPGNRKRWLPDDWRQGIRTAASGNERVCFISPQGHFLYHKGGVEKYLGRELPNLEG